MSKIIPELNNLTYYDFWTTEENDLLKSDNFYYLIFNMTDTLTPFKILTDECHIEPDLFEFTEHRDVITFQYINGKKVLINIKEINKYVVIIEDREGLYYAASFENNDLVIIFLNSIKNENYDFIFIVVDLENFSPSFKSKGTLIERSGDIKIYNCIKQNIPNIN